MRVVALSLFLAVTVVSAAPVGAQLSVDVNAALSRAVARLLENQRADGSFAPAEGSPDAAAGYPMGGVALTVYALRKSGLQPSDPALVSALGYLMARPLEKTYSVSALALALDAVGQREHEARLLEAADWIADHQDERTGLWAYPDGETDLSNTQFAVLALKAAARHGHETPSRLWADVVEGTLDRQLEDGGFHYRSNYWPQSSGSMTTAGLTTLYVALSFLEATGQHPAQQKLAREAIERGWAWLDARFSATGGPVGTPGVFEDRYPEFGRSDHHHYYYLYGMERVATLAGRDTVGGIAWYPAIATEMLSAESADGGWGSLANTCMAMLVLRRATLSGARAPLSVGAADPDAPSEADGTRIDGRARESGEAGAEWAYTTDEPRKGWNQPGFDDGRWARGPGGFGAGATGLVVRTPWETHDLWVRRTFPWVTGGHALRLFVIHDDAVEIWINGEAAASGPVWSGGRYREYALSSAARRSLRTGENLIAATVHDDGGGRSLDIRFTPPADTSERSEAWRRSLPQSDVPYLRRWELLGPLDDEEHAALLEHQLPTAVAGGHKLGKRSWEPHRSLCHRLQVDEVMGGRPGTVTWASVWLHGSDERDAWLWLGVGDGVRAWLDGEPLLLHHEHGAARPDELRVPLSLKAGAQHLVLLLEQSDVSCPLYARIAGSDGEPLDGLRFALTGEAPDDPTVAVAQPDLFDLATLARRLPEVGLSSLRFDRQDDLDGVAFSGERDDDPTWIARTSDKSPAPRAPSGARGVVCLWPPPTDRPARLLARVQLGPRARTLGVTVALREDATVGGRLRLLLYDGARHTLLETDVAPDLSTDRGRGRPGFVRLSADVANHAGQGVLCVLEWSALPGGVVQPLFVDELDVR